ncbi:MAG: MBL fold metallo-hydrolase [Desulfatitalea sp.]|nr:MBL fold metallo-hydrolase [Desulfatitalea sp.]NNJ99569.1 MBL fold metallo-hydrolase [Desulfatitalea sp.]
MVQEIRPELYLIEIPLPDNPLKYLNAYVLRSAQRNLIVDTGLNRKACLDAMKTGLRQLDVDLAETDFFITHMHADHFGLVAALATPTSKIFFNRPDAELIEAKGYWEPMLVSAAKNGFPQDELRYALEHHPGYKYSSDWIPELSMMKDGDPIRVGDYHFTCVHTPGHSMGHTCLYEPEKKLFIAGDHILVDITPNIQCWYEDLDPLADYLSSLDRVRALDIELVLPGHRRLIHDHRERIDELKQHHATRCQEILEILDDGDMNAYETASRMTWEIRANTWEDFPVAQKWFATGEAIAHLRYLAERKRIRERIENNRIIYAKMSIPAEA